MTARSWRVGRSWKLGVAAALVAAALLGAPASSAQTTDQNASVKAAAKPAGAESAAPKEEKAPPRRIALKGGTVLTGDGPALVGATVLIEGGKVAGVGRDLAIPDGAEIVDVTGKFVFPGLLDAGSVIGLAPSDAANAAKGMRVADALDPFSSGWKRVLSGGVTAAFVAPRVTSPATGTFGAVLKIRPGVAPGDVVVKDVAAVRASVGVSSGTSDTITRWRSARALEKALDGAKSYRKAREKYDKGLAKWKKDLAAWRTKVGIPDPEASTAKKTKADEPRKKKAGKPSADKGAGKAGNKTPKKADKKPAKKPTKKKKPTKRPKAPRRFRVDPVKSALLDVLDRKIPLRVEAHRVEDIERTLDVVEKFKIRLVLEGATEAASLARRLAEAEVAVVAGPLLLADPRRLEYENHDPSGLGALARAGVPIAIASASPRPTAARFLRLAAARAQASGLDRAAAFAAITSTAADVLGVGKRLGSLAAGKDADLVIADRHPLDTACRIECVYIDGKPVFQAVRP